MLTLSHSLVGKAEYTGGSSIWKLGTLNSRIRIRTLYKYILLKDQRYVSTRVDYRRDNDNVNQRSDTSLSIKCIEARRDHE